MMKKIIIAISLAAAVVIWIFAPGESAGIVIVLGVAALAIGSLRKKKSEVRNSSTSNLPER